jgi:hypothetical protein
MNTKRTPWLTNAFVCTLFFPAFLLTACGGADSGGGPTTKPTSAPPATLASIQVTPAAPSVAKGLTQQFKATGTYSDGTTADVTSQSAWASTVTPVATINASSGLEQSVSPGTTSITATVGSVSGSTTLTVTAPVGQSIAITPNKVAVSVGASQHLSAVLTYSDGTTADVTSQASWTSSATPVATVVSTSGVVTGVSAGSAMITATVGSINSTSTVSVVTATWTATGSMTLGHERHTATLLANGKVLVAGGEEIRPIANVGGDLYDPASGTWSGVALQIPRVRHSATPLSDGRVLIVGGDHGEQFQANPYNSAEIYDPATGTSTATGNLLTARAGHTATLLPNGKVLVAGGQITGTMYPAPTASAELFDPATGSFVSTNNMLSPHFGASAFLLANGKVLVVAGNGQSPPTAELYDPATQIWSATGPLAEAYSTSLSQMSATLLADGKVLLTGGSAALAGTPNVVVLATCELYDPATNVWTATGSLNFARGVHTATLLANGRVLVAGGVDSTQLPISSAEIYDPTAGTWSLSASLPGPLSLHTATLLMNGQVLVAGGDGNTPTTVGTAAALLYTP